MVFGFRQKKGQIFGKDQLFGRQRIFGVGKEPNIRLFGYSVRPVVGRSLNNTGCAYNTNCADSALF
jgi:hypothetical protein